jgi:hypothetical protein
LRTTIHGGMESGSSRVDTEKDKAAPNRSAAQNEQVEALPSPSPSEIGRASQPKFASLDEQFGYQRCEIDRDQAALHKMQEQQRKLKHDIQAIKNENELLESQLLQELTTWRSLDDANTHASKVIPTINAITSSMTYRLVAAILRILRSVTRLATFGWLRKEP